MTKNSAAEGLIGAVAAEFRFGRTVRGTVEDDWYTVLENIVLQTFLIPVRENSDNGTIG